MKERELLIPWVEKVLMEILETDHVHTDDDGDYPIGLENTVAYVRVDQDPAKNVRVQICAPILRDVVPNPELFEKLNDINLNLAYFRFRWRRGVVDANTELVGEAFRTEEARIVLEALDAYAEQLPELLDLPEATTWKSIMEASQGDRSKPKAGRAGAEPEEESTVASGTDDGSDSVGATSKRKRGPKGAKGEKRQDPDEHPPPGYL